MIELEAQAIAFHFRRLEERKELPTWQPSHSHRNARAIVLTNSVKAFAVYSFRETTKGVKFRALTPEVSTLSEVLALLDRNDALSMRQLGMSSREIGRVLGVSHETARVKSNG